MDGVGVFDGNGVLEAVGVALALGVAGGDDVTAIVGVAVEAAATLGIAV